MKIDWQLDSRIENDSYAVLSNENYELRLHKNALFTWFILIPKTNETELFLCDEAFQHTITNATFDYAKRLKISTQADKINLAMLGNVVPQLHIHIIARFQHDDAWPSPVWQHPNFKAYDPTTLKKRMAFLVNK